MTQLLPRLVLLALLAGAVACGTGVPDDDSDDGDGDGCGLSFSVDPVEREERVVGRKLQVTAYVDGGSSGFAEYEWTVTSDGEPIPFDDTNRTDGSVIELTPASAGIHEIALAGSIGGLTCTSAQDTLNVLASGARLERFVLRVVPGAGGDVPAQDRPIEVFGGDGEFSLGSLAVSLGSAVAGRSSDAAGDAVPVYLRAWQTLAVGGAPRLLSEATTGPDGEYTLHLLDQKRYELLVVPVDPSLAPYAIAEATSLEIPAAVSYLPGEPVTGTVVDSDGAPVVGATVSLVVGGVPSSIAITDVAGGFALEVRAGASVSVIVSPPDASGLPRLELVAPEATLSAGGAVHVAYSALAARQVTLAVRAADGETPAPGARVTWIARPIDAAGTVRIDEDGERTATGLVRRTLAAGEGGETAAALLPETIYDVLVDPPASAAGQAAAALEVDLASSDPTTVSLAQPSALRGRVLVPGASADEPLAGVRIQAAPRGLMAGATSAGAAARTDGDGRFALSVAGGGEYEITADATALGYGRLRWLFTAPAPGGDADLEPVVLPRVLRASGELLTFDGAPVPGAHLQVFCAACAPGGGTDAVAEAVTDPAGGFELVLPDPGVAPE
jgi:hypothetical protein